MLLPVLVVLGVFLWFFASLGNLGTAQSEEGREQLEQSLRKAAAAYYAAEGVYPPTIEELVGRSGVQIDETRYCVFYEIFADNLMPDITVLGNER